MVPRLGQSRAVGDSQELASVAVPPGVAVIAETCTPEADGWLFVGDGCPRRAIGARFLVVSLKGLATQVLGQRIQGEADEGEHPLLGVGHERTNFEEPGRKC